MGPFSLASAPRPVLAAKRPGRHNPTEAEKKARGNSSKSSVSIVGNILVVAELKKTSLPPSWLTAQNNSLGAAKRTKRTLQWFTPGMEIVMPPLAIQPSFGLFCVVNARELG